jgi:uncharacterized protein (TIGR01777 family)
MNDSRTVLLTGATGFLGRLLALRLAREGYEVLAWVRSPERARAALGIGPRLLRTDISEAGLRAELSHVHAVIHLAGEPLFGPRWTDARRAELRSSRVDTTARLARAIASATRKPKAFVVGSAVGFYGPHADEPIDERSSNGSDFLSALCRDWESAAEPAVTAGVRTAWIRTGIVLGPEGGALAKMLPPFRFGLGGKLGSGKQWMPWIHVDDWIELVMRALEDSKFSGAINATAPQPVTNADFTKALGRALSRPTPFPAPGFALKLALGDVADLLLTGARVLPKRAEELGFRFRFPDLDSALADLLNSDAGITIGASEAPPKHEYFASRRARYMLRSRMRVHAPLEDVFAFFSRSENLGAITPPTMAFSLESRPPIDMHVGREIDYKVQIGPVALDWRSRIDTWQPGVAFSDSQLVGPYSCWWHEHHFARDGAHTIMEDRVWYAPPLGPLGVLAQKLLVAPKLATIFGYRTRAMRLRFGATPLEAA